MESFRLRVADGGSFVFATVNRPERMEAISLILERAGARSIGPGAWSLDGSAGTLDAVTDLFDRLEMEECIYVLRQNEGVLSYGVIAEAKTEGGIEVGP